MTDTETDTDLSWLWDVCHPLERGGFGSFVQATATDKKAGTTLFVASTAKADRAMDVIDQGGWKLRNYRANPIIMADHRLPVVGHAIEVGVPRVGDDAGQLMLRAKWDLDNPDPSIQAVGHQHLNGVRRAGSVGFKPGKRTLRSRLPTDHVAYQEPVEVDTPWGPEKVSGFYFERSELMEFSSAAIPANPDAIQRSYLAELGLHDPEDIDARIKVVGETVPRVVALDLLSMWKTATDEQRAVLLDLVWADLAPRIEAHLRTEAIGRVIRAQCEFVPKSAPQPRGDGLDFLYPPHLET